MPVHFDGWSHFSEQRTELQSVLGDAPRELAERLLWLTPGHAATVADPPVRAEATQ